MDKVEVATSVVYDQLEEEQTKLDPKKIDDGISDPDFGLKGVWKDIKRNVLTDRSSTKRRSTMEPTVVATHRSHVPKGFLRIDLKCGPRHGDLYTSLDDFFVSELFDGDNRITCDVCEQKMDMTRSTVLGRCPSIFFISLKRFDLNYDTFETVKLNDRLQFPVELNMHRYTLEGKQELTRLAALGDDAGTLTPKGGGEHAR